MKKNLNKIFIFVIIINIIKNTMDIELVDNVKNVQ